MPALRQMYYRRHADWFIALEGSRLGPLIRAIEEKPFPFLSGMDAFWERGQGSADSAAAVLCRGAPPGCLSHNGGVMASSILQVHHG